MTSGQARNHEFEVTGDHMRAAKTKYFISDVGWDTWGGWKIVKNKIYLKNYLKSICRLTRNRLGGVFSPPPPSVFPE